MNKPLSDAFRALSAKRPLSENTRDQYRAILNTLGRAVADAGALAGDMNYAEALVTWLLHKAPLVRPGTWMLWRAAVRDYFHRDGSDAALAADARLVRDAPKDGFKGVIPGGTQKLYASASTRRRYVRMSEFRALINYLSSHGQRAPAGGTKRNSVVIACLKATMAAGLRPSEWPSARWCTEDSLVLVVSSKKRREADQTLPAIGSDIARPVERRIRILDQDRLWVDLYLDCVRQALESGVSYVNFLAATQKARYEACLALDINITFYMLRGQFAADRKKMQGLATTAAEMGNAPRKASSYYGTVGNARPGVKASADRNGARQSFQDRMDTQSTSTPAVDADTESSNNHDNGFFESLA